MTHSVRARAWAVMAALQALVPAAASAAELVDRVVAVVENTAITYRELEAKAAAELAAAPRLAEPTAAARQRETILRRVLDEEIGERVIVAELARNRDRLGVGEKDVDRAVEEVMRLNGLTREQLQAALFGQGLTWDGYRDRLRDQVERARLIQHRTQGRVQIRDADARRRCLERRRADARDVEICASHILFTGADRAALRARAERVRRRLVAGASFAACARENTADRAAPDGHLGCFRRGEMVEALDAAAFALAPGEISEIVESDFGLHLVQVSERRAGGGDDAACDQPDALEPFRGELYQEAVQQQLASWTDELRRRAFVEVRL